MADRLAIVTGAAGGLGPAIARRIAEDFEAVLIADLREDRLGGIAEEIGGATGARVLTAGCDVSDPAEVAAVYETAAREGSITGLVNAAGIGIYTPLTEITPEHWDRMFAINTRGTFLMSQEFVRRAEPPAAIVNISSVGARAGNDMLAHYGASKAAVIEFSHSVARACARTGIRSNTVMPGIIFTDMWRSTIAYLQEQDPEMAKLPVEAVFAGIVDQAIPTGRAQEPEDIAEAVAFFLGDRAKNITGQTLAVDGGMLLT
jgi:NAD(P)-dependent dehydrogenase (short-subunit alcohol dehydrogenase family)